MKKLWPWKRLLWQWPSLLVDAFVFLGVGVVMSGHFRIGTSLIAVALFFAFLLRVALSERRIGWLAVRSKAMDIATLGGLAIALEFLAIVVPPPHGS